MKESFGYAKAMKLKDKVLVLLSNEKMPLAVLEQYTISDVRFCQIKNSTGIGIPLGRTRRNLNEEQYKLIQDFLSAV